MAGWLGTILAAFVAPPAPLVDLIRTPRFWGGAVVELDLPSIQGASRTDGLSRVTRGLEAMRSDPMVRGLHLRLRGTRGGWARVQELRSVLSRFKASGKPVFVEMEAAGNGDLYLASVASRVYMMPTGQVHAAGLAARLTFYGDALRKLGARVEVITSGTFKSFGEPFTRAWPTEENREAVEALLGDLQDQMVAAVALGRKLEPGLVLDALANVPLSAEEALDRSLVDELLYPDQVRKAIMGELGFKPRRIPFHAWSRWMWIRGLHRRIAGFRDNVAVVHLRGSVVSQAPMGGGGDRIASDQVVPLLESLRRSASIGAVVLAVDSGGGSAMASDVIWRAVCRLRERKPVVAVFGNVAASGAYYLAAPAAFIFAQPGTVTGSIGVVGGKLVLGHALTRLGIHATVIKGLPSSDMDDVGRAFSPEERLRMERSIAKTYQVFLERVASGRRRPVRSVEPLAGGRIWSGSRALDLGLVDAIGTSRDAWVKACRLADLTPDRRQTGWIDIHLTQGGAWSGILRNLLSGFSLFGGVTGRLASLVAHLVDSEIPAGSLDLAEQVVAFPGEAMALAPWDLQIG